MVIEKTRIDRRKALKADRDRRRLVQLLHEIQAELQDDEVLGQPYRGREGIVIPVVKAPRSR